MKSKLFSAIVLFSLVVLALSHSAFAYVTNNSWYDPQNNPWGLDERTVANLEALLMDISMRSQNADLRMLTVRSLDVAGGGRLSLESLRDGVLTDLGREHVDRFLTTIFIWVSEEGVFYVSLPEQLQRMISTTVINKIIEDELTLPLWAGTSVSDALFNTVGRLGRYIILAAETGPQGDQMYMPPAPEHPYIGYHSVFDIPLAPQPTNTPSEEPEFRFVTPEENSEPEPDKSNNNMLIIGLLILLVGGGAAIAIIRRRQSEDYYEDDWDDYNDYDDDMFDDDDSSLN